MTFHHITSYNSILQFSEKNYRIRDAVTHFLHGTIIILNGDVMNLLFVLLTVAGAILIIFMIKKLTIGKIFLSVASGLCALFCCDLVMSFISSGGMPINPYTLTISALGGIPGVTLLVLLRMLL